MTKNKILILFEDEYTSAAKFYMFQVSSAKKMGNSNGFNLIKEIGMCL